MFFATTKTTSNSPRLPRNPPQLHHVFTAQRHGGNLKTPCKNGYSAPHIFFLTKTVELKEWESAEKKL
jgi:hypothetical protein